MKRILSQIALIGIDKKDDDNTRLKKALLVIGAIPFAFAGVLWGVLYILFGLPMAGLIPLSYALVSVISIIHFARTRRFKFFRFSQLLLILLLPFLLMISLGGFINGSGVILWSLISPFGALLFDKPQRALFWFIAFVGLVLISGLLESYLIIPSELPLNILIFFFVINIASVGSLIFLLVYYFVGQKNNYQEKSEALLLNILPKEIAAILKKETRTIADHFENASILFADVVDFTSLSLALTPVQLVELLNEVFSHFDAIVEKYGLEKIKTIGDCYMVASGVPRPRADHAKVLVALALEMREYVKQHKFNGQKLQFRMGLNCGPVVAGVIGTKKFIYDLWGDAVNTASRMESQGKEGTIQITQAMYDLIKYDYKCERGGTIHIKGKGEMEVWSVLG